MEASLMQPPVISHLLSRLSGDETKEPIASPPACPCPCPCPCLSSPCPFLQISELGHAMLLR